MEHILWRRDWFVCQALGAAQIDDFMGVLWRNEITEMLCCSVSVIHMNKQKLENACLKFIIYRGKPQACFVLFFWKEDFFLWTSENLVILSLEMAQYEFNLISWGFFRTSVLPFTLTIIFQVLPTLQQINKRSLCVMLIDGFCCVYFTVPSSGLCPCCCLHWCGSLLSRSVTKTTPPNRRACWYLGWFSLCFCRKPFGSDTTNCWSKTFSFIVLWTGVMGM